MGFELKNGSAAAKPAPTEASAVLAPSDASQFFQNEK
jgi:hypothetical protein